MSAGQRRFTVSPEAALPVGVDPGWICQGSCVDAGVDGRMVLHVARTPRVCSQPAKRRPCDGRNIGRTAVATAAPAILGAGSAEHETGVPVGLDPTGGPSTGQKPRRTRSNAGRWWDSNPRPDDDKGVKGG